MPLPAALQARLAKRGLVKKTEVAPDEEIIAEDYDDHGHNVDTAGDVGTLREKNVRKNEISAVIFACPNKWNVYHECSPYCREFWGNVRIKPSADVEKKRKKMLQKYPLDTDWEEIYDPGTGRHYYWNTETDDVSWLAPKHPKAKIGPCAVKVRKMILEAEESRRRMSVLSDSESDLSESSEEEENVEHSKKTEKHHQKDFSRGRRKHKDNDLDPMDPASYSDISRGSWSTGLESKGDAKTGADTTASGPLFQMRPYPSPGAVLRANADRK